MQMVKIITIRLLIHLTIIIIIIIPSFVFSQTQSEELSKARELFDNSQFRKANKILKKLNMEYPEDLNTQWLYSQSVYWSRKFNRSMVLYEGAIASHPDNYYLLLDYGIKLVDMGAFRKALPILEKYLAYDNQGPDALVALSKMAYWQGNYKKALAQIDSLLLVQPDNTKAKELYEEIKLAKSPLIQFSTLVSDDDQPLFSIQPSLKVSKSENAYFNPSITLGTPYFVVEDSRFQAYNFSLSNRFNFSKLHTSISAEWGLFQLPNREIIFTGGIKLSQSITRQLGLELSVNHKPYLSTRANMNFPVRQVQYDFAVNWKGKHGWMGSIGHTLNDFYTDNNQVHSSGIWILSQPLKLANTESRAGYAISYSNTHEDRFIPDRNIDQIIDSWTVSQSITGFYFPYFTPNEQFVNSLIYQFNYKPTIKFEVGLNAKYGFRGTTRNPYLYLNTDLNHNIFIQKEFYEDTFSPYEGKVYFHWNLSRKVSLQSAYSLLSTYFYKSQAGIITIHVRM
jgi:hypothetical protein